MQADILDAVATWLGDEMSVPVYYPDLPRSMVEAPPRTKMLVITPGGSVQSAGTNSYVKVARARADIRCYGETSYQAMNVYRELAGFLKDLKPRVVNTGPNLDIGVHIDNAIESVGPTVITDPDTQENVVYATWGVHGSEIVVGAVEVPSVNPTLIFKTVDETNATTSFTNDDELRFTVVAGHRYTMRMSVAVLCDNDTGNAAVIFDVPTDVVFDWSPLRAPNGPVAATLPGINQENELDDLATAAMQFISGTIDASLAGGEVVFQFRNPDGNTSGGVTVKAGSMIELFDLGVIP